MGFKRTVLSAISLIALLSSVTFVSADTSDKKIALSNNYAGNTWRQVMLKDFDETSKGAIKAGIIAEADAFTTAENQATEQAAQIQNMILQGYDAIIIDASSPTALNGAVKEACDAGIIVVSFDGIVTEPCAWRITSDFADMSEKKVDYIASVLPNGGNILNIRGVAGTSIDDDNQKGIERGLAKYPNLKIVGTVNGDWAQDVAQRAVAGILPSMPKIDAVIGQSGDGYGAAQAFAAATDTTPIIVLGGNHDELVWWKQQKDANGYKTISVSNPASIVSAAFWIAQQILDGKEVKKDLTFPSLTITQDNFEEVLAKTEKGGIADFQCELDCAQKIIAETN